MLVVLALERLSNDGINMFSLASGIYESYLAAPKLTILLVGGQGVGKTTFLERAKVTDFATKPPKAKQKTTVVLPPQVPDGSFLFFGDDSHQPEPTPNVTSAKKKKTNANNSNGAPPPTAALTTRKSWFICPAPPKYTPSMEESDDELDVDQQEDEFGSLHVPQTATTTKLPHYVPPPLPPASPGTVRRVVRTLPDKKNGPASSDSMLRTSQESMQSINLSDAQNGDDSSSHSEDESTADVAKAQHAQSTRPSPPATTQLQKDYHLKKGAQMLPLVKIRPTIGMNVGKLGKVCGCNISIQDVGGKLHNLWNRYYKDCDAVIFVWKLVGEEDDGNESDDSDDPRPPMTWQLQLELLKQVRQAIDDDVPFLILGHIFPSHPALHQEKLFDCLYSTDVLFPHYHNPSSQGLFFCNAVTGRGVKPAMEWLVPLAQRRAKVQAQLQQKQQQATTD